MFEKTTVMVDLDDCLWDLVSEWIDEYKFQYKNLHIVDYTLNTHEQSMSKSKVTSWNIEECLKPTDRELFWKVLDDGYLWYNLNVPDASKTALERLNSHENIDLIICTATSYKYAYPKIGEFLYQCPFIEPEQIILANSKHKILCDVAVDDKPDTLEKFMLSYFSPVTIKIKQPWNTTTICDKEFDMFGDRLVNYIIEIAEYQARLKERGKEYERYDYD